MEWGCDLQSEHERYITEEAFGGCPVIVRDYPKVWLSSLHTFTMKIYSESFISRLLNLNFQEIKAFYMRQNDDGKTVAAMDMLVPRV